VSTDFSRQDRRVRAHPGTVLITRRVDGIRPTPEGAEILAAAKPMEEAAFSLVRARNRAMPAMSSEVRIGITEAFGAFWLGPRLVEFQRACPQLGVDLMCAMRPADVLRMEVDVAIQLDCPTSPDVEIVRLGRIHSMLAAAPSYLAIYGTPKTIEDLRKHRLAMQFADQTKSQEVFTWLFPDVELRKLVKFSTNNSSALLWAIIEGAGIGWSPTRWDRRWSRSISTRSSRSISGSPIIPTRRGCPGYGG
jgi:DNA-binding transcriptional LysR family regulator